MIDNHIISESFVIGKELAKDSFFKINLFCSQHGNITAMYRNSPKKTAPDLFDKAEISLKKSTQGNLYFIEDYQLVQRFKGIASNYNKLTYACNFCNFLRQNPSVDDSVNSIYQLTNNAFTAWNKNNSGYAIIYLKSLYVYLKNEGLPVKEDWINSLNTSHIDTCRTILHSKTEECLEHEDVAKTLSYSLEKWIQTNADFLSISL